MAKEKQKYLNSRKPIRLLGEFSPENWEGCLRFLNYRAPFYGERKTETLGIFLEQARHFIRKDAPFTFTEFIAGTKLPTSSNQFDKLSSLVYKFLQEFVAVEELSQDTVLEQKLATRFYLKSELDWKEVDRRFEEAGREAGKAQHTTRRRREVLSLDLERMAYAKSRSIPHQSRNMASVLKDLRKEFLCEELRILCAVCNDHRIYGQKLPEVNWKQLGERLEVQEDLLSQAYFLTLQVLSQEENTAAVAHLDDILQKIDFRAADAPVEDLQDIYGYLLNHFIAQSNSGKPGSMEILADIYGKVVDRGIILEDGLLSAEHFKNLISVKVKVGAVKEARRYLNAFRGKLSTDYGRFGWDYNEAMVCYAERNLPKAAALLEQLIEKGVTLKSDEFYVLDARSNLLKVYLELLETASPGVWDETDVKLRKLLDAFLPYIQRRKLPPGRRESYLGFLKRFERCYRACFPPGFEPPGQQRELLRREWEQEPDFRHKEWLLTRLMA